MGQNMRNKFRILFVLPFLVVSFVVSAQDTTLVEGKEEYNLLLNDSTDTSIDDWKASRDFNYIHYLDSLLRVQPLSADTVRLNKKTGETISGAKQKEKPSFLARLLHFEGAHVFFWLLALLFIGVIIYKVFIQSGFFFTGRKRKNISPEDVNLEELKTAHAYEQFIQEAEQKEDYSLATRYWYLKTLKNLKDLELIQYSPDKTNQEYLSELRGNTQLDHFNNLTRHYEYVWYGKFFLQKERYLKIKDSFVVFNINLMNSH